MVAVDEEDLIGKGGEVVQGFLLGLFTFSDTAEVAAYDEFIAGAEGGARSIVPETGETGKIPVGVAGYPDHGDPSFQVLTGRSNQALRPSFSSHSARQAQISPPAKPMSSCH